MKLKIYFAKNYFTHHIDHFILLLNAR